MPAPLAEAGTVLVGVTHSCISIGTELSGVRASALPLWRRAMKHPDKVRSVLRDVKSHGLKQTWEKVETTVSNPLPLGYSAAGVVLEIGDGITDLAVGERVACAG
ncbi:MAG: oxidoreductase, partial [Gemmatimonadaceae bacterium]|nr:oxidoreductase [Gemmatimonadaceae bacterium]